MIPPTTRNDLTAAANPLLKLERLEAVEVQGLTSPTVHSRPLGDRDRELRDLRRKQTAAEAIAGLTRENELFGFTKGQFSLLQLIEAVLDVTGPAHVTLSTWTAARSEIARLDQLRQAGTVTGMRFLVDLTFSRRDPEAAEGIRRLFGHQCVRVAQNHAKFVLFENESWRLVLRTSMNLNMNPRLEDFTLAADLPLFDFLATVCREIWTQQRAGMQHDDPTELARRWRRDDWGEADSAGAAGGSGPAVDRGG